MSRYRVNVNQITSKSFNPPSGCKPEEVIASWVHATQIVIQDHKRELAKPTRDLCVGMLQNTLLSDMEAVEAVRTALKRRGWS